MRRWMAISVFLALTVAAPSQTNRAEYARWRAGIRQALFIPERMPAVDPRSFGHFSPVPGVVAERVTYTTLYGMRVPAIVYRPEKIIPGAKLPGLVVVVGHGGDKTSWYAYYAGILYAQAGAVVVTYDPVGEDERNAARASATRQHDTVIAGAGMPRRMGGQMIADVMQATAYLATRSDVDADRIGVLAFSMGSFHAAIAGALDARIHSLVLSAGGNLDGPGGYWDRSPKVMCQSGPYHALEILGDRGAVLYALNAQRGATLVMNGTADTMIVSAHTDEAFFADLRRRTEKITGSERNLPETMWFEGAGHRPSFVTRAAALWLYRQLRFPNWTEAAIEALPGIRIEDWSKQTGGEVSESARTEAHEWGVMALDVGVPAIPREQLQAVPAAAWAKEKDAYTWEGWVRRVHAIE